MAKPVYLLGGGGHGRVVLDALIASGANVIGIFDPGMQIGNQVFGVPVLGGDDLLDAIAPAEVMLVNGIGANPRVYRRQKLFEDMKAREFSFGTIRHPSSVIGLECDLSEGSQVMAGAVLQNRVRVGENAVVNTRASIDHDCVIGRHAFISPGAVFCGDVILADSAFIGSGAVLLPGIQIGAGAIVGAGAVVTKSIPARWIVAGNPAVKIGMNE